MVALGSTTASGETLFAKNSDRPARECQPLGLHERQSHPSGAETGFQFVSLPNAPTSYRHVGSRPYWCHGYEHGFNEHQVVIGNEGLFSKFEPATEPKLIGMEVLRLGLERGKSAAEAVDVMTDAISRVGQGKFENNENVRTYDNGYIVADPREAYVIETAGHEWAVKRVEKALGISNVYSIETDWDSLSLGAETASKENGWWQASEGRFNFADTYSHPQRMESSGAIRRRRSCEVLGQTSGQVDVRTMISILSDHSDERVLDKPDPMGLPPSICVHCENDGTGGNTAASVVANLCADDSRLPIYWSSFYSPCLGLFLPIFIEGELPRVLAEGDEDPSDQSPWWRFHELSRLARADSGESIFRVRERWAGLQEELFQSATRMAKDGADLMNEGREEDASQLLSSYMDENVKKMLAAFSELLEEFGESSGQASAVRSQQEKLGLLSAEC